MDIAGIIRSGRAEDGAITAQEHWVERDGIRLHLFRKFAEPHPHQEQRKILFLVHGSSQSSRTTYDLQAGDLGEYSTMNVFARLGYDVWTVDHEGYGRSDRTDGFSTIRDNARDLNAACAFIESTTGQTRFNFFGTSSGALRAGLFQNLCPERVERLAMAAFPWTGKNAPSLVKRRARLSEWQATNRRLVDATYYHNMLTRDVEGLTDPDLATIVAENEMSNGGDSVPNGTYVDMCINLPIVDPALITCPVLMIRSEYDGITTDEDMMAFYARLATKDRQMTMVSGQAHNITFGVNRHRFWYALAMFLGFPERHDSLADDRSQEKQG